MSNSLLLIQPGTILEKRYEILQELGRGGFGRTYLAKDHNRFQEFCVLKEFAPQVQNNEQLELAKTLFAREAGMLYQLQHEQIPRFRELLKANLHGKETLFLVQDYIEGKTYWQILQAKKQFNQVEVKQLIFDILPILEYIHNRNLIHRDISPDNLIQRTSDHKPILIDFGCVKQAAVNAVTQFGGQSFGTMLGKKGYAPDEQIRQGKAFPSSDLYALAVTVLVLLTGKLPQELYNNENEWRWRHLVNIEPNFADILDKMLAQHPINRYQSVSELNQALTQETNSNVNQIVSTIPTLVIAPGNNRNQQNILNPITTTLTQIRTKFNTNTQPVTQSVNNLNTPKSGKFLRFAFAAITAIFIPGIITFSIIKGIKINIEFPSFPKLPIFSNPNNHKTETERQQEINERLQKLKLAPSKFNAEVDRLFYQKYPQLKGVKLTDKPEHKKYREAWYKIAEDLLDKKKKNNQQYRKL